jgi:hypothetical protein
MAAVAVVFDGDSSVRRRLMVSVMDYCKRTSCFSCPFLKMALKIFHHQ